MFDVDVDDDDVFCYQMYEVDSPPLPLPLFLSLSLPLSTHDSLNNSIRCFVLRFMHRKSKSTSIFHESFIHSLRFQLFDGNDGQMLNASSAMSDEWHAIPRHACYRID